MSAFSKTSSYQLNVFFRPPLICSLARPCGVERCPVWPRPGIMRQRLLPQPPSLDRNTSFIPHPPTLYLCVGQTVYVQCQNKICPERSRFFFCCAVSTVSLPISLSVSTQDVPVEAQRLLNQNEATLISFSVGAILGRRLISSYLAHS